MENKKRALMIDIVAIAAVTVLIVLQFILHLKTPFIKDDLWYATDLVSGEPIRNFWQIITSQYWHYFNWGGRIINHGVLQAVLATGELGAAIINTIVTILLGVIICMVSRTRKPVMFLLAESAIVAFNASIHFSMYWESGSVNYLYSSCWILIYIFVIVREVSPDSSKFKLVELWIIPLALISGWSTENMGPTCAFIALLVILYKLYNKQKVRAFIWEAFVFSSIGSVLLILAPGNFVRNQFSDKLSLMGTLYNRILSIWNATSIYLFPTILIALTILIVEVCVMKRKVSVYNWMLIVFASVAQAAMFLSPTYPQRTSFGIMTVLIAFLISILKEYLSDKNKKIFVELIAASIYVAAVLVVISDLVFPVFEILE